MSLSLLPTAAPPRSGSAPPAPLAGRLGTALASRGVSYCQWKGHGKRERWESGRGDIDLLVDSGSWRDFVDVAVEKRVEVESNSETAAVVDVSDSCDGLRRADRRVVEVKRHHSRPIKSGDDKMPIAVPRA